MIKQDSSLDAGLRARIALRVPVTLSVPTLGRGTNDSTQNFHFVKNFVCEPPCRWLLKWSYLVNMEASECESRLIFSQFSRSTVALLSGVKKGASIFLLPKKKNIWKGASIWGALAVGRPSGGSYGNLAPLGRLPGAITGRPWVNHRSTLGQPGVNLGSTWGVP